eukprot:COSAG06_NODE_30897_length_530_cov_1.069606_2_plen_22_part_01
MMVTVAQQRERGRQQWERAEAG